MVPKIEKVLLYYEVPMKLLNQWFPKWAVPPHWGRWETLEGRWSRNGRLGGDRRPS